MPPITGAQLVNQKDLTVNELAALADMITLSQAKVQSLMAEVTGDGEVLVLVAGEAVGRRQTART